MRITFDSEADAMYIYIKEGPSARTQELDNYETMVDFDKKGEVIGIELLSVSHRMPAKFVSDLKSAGKLGGIPVEVFGNGRMTKKLKA